MVGKHLVEVNDSSNIQTSKKDGDVYIVGEYGRVGVPTKNGRIYPENIMNRELKKLSEDMKNGRVFGSADHPADGKTTIYNVSHILEDLYIKDGVVYGRSKVIKESLGGKQLLAIVNAGGKPGMSSRGWGTTKPAMGKFEGEEVQEDFVLKTFDAVIDPAMGSAIPEFQMESVQDTWKDELLGKYPQLVECVDSMAPMVESKKDDSKEEMSEDILERFEKKLAEAIIAIREDVTAELQESYDSDPEIGGAKSVLAQIAEMVGVYASSPDSVAVKDALKAKDVAIAEAQADKEVAEEEYRKVKMALVLEQKIGNHPMAESIRLMLGHGRFDSETQLTEAIESLMAQMPGGEKSEFVSKKELTLKEENMQLSAKAQSLMGDIKLLKDKLRRAVELGESIDAERKDYSQRLKKAEADITELKESMESQLSEAQRELGFASKELEEAKLELYKREKTAGLANSSELMGLVEGVNSRESVDKILKKQGAKRINDNMLEQARQYVAQGNDGSGEQMEIGQKVLAEDDASDFANSFAQEMGGISLRDLQYLSTCKQ